MMAPADREAVINMLVFGVVTGTLLVAIVVCMGGVVR